jgi:uncharacterized protein YkwD
MTARHRLLPVVATALFASLTLSASTAHAADCAGANLLPALSSVPTAKAATLCLLNGERASRGLLPLAEQPVLEAAAQTYSQSMVSQRFFDHVSPNGQTIDDRLASYVGAMGSGATGENLAWGQGALATPASILRTWMSSAGHRDNVLNPSYDDVGVGITTGTPNGGLPALGATYVTEFGGHSSAAGQPSELRASASSDSPRPVAKRVSAKQKKQISKRCHTAARRVKSSKKARAARYDRCVKKATRAAAR